MNTDSTDLDATFDKAWPPDQWRDVHVVLAVSGGADSVAMLRLAVEAKQRALGAGRLHVAHFDHRLRPIEAAEDARWVAQLCRRLGIPCEMGAADVRQLAERKGDGLEAAAREARYRFLTEAAQRLGARFVATAHTADDQIETVLHRVIRGTGLAGLAGMPQFRPLSPMVTLVRPLLHVRHIELVQYLDGICQDFRRDPSNSQREFTRNQLRLDLLPALRSKFNAHVDGALLRLAEQAGEAKELLEALARNLVRQTMSVEHHVISIECPPLAAESPLLVREACKLAWSDAGWPLQDMGFDQLRQLATLVTSDATNGCLNLPANVLARRCDDRVEIAEISGFSRSP